MKSIITRQCFPSVLLWPVLLGCVWGAIQYVVWLQELPSPAGGAALTAALEPEHHLPVTFKFPLQHPCVGDENSGEDRVWSADDEFKFTSKRWTVALILSVKGEFWCSQAVVPNLGVRTPARGHKINLMIISIRHSAMQNYNTVINF